MSGIRLSLWTFLLILLILILLAVVVWITILPIKTAEEITAQTEMGTPDKDVVEQVEQGVEESLRELERALLSSDLETLENKCADGYILTTRSGEVWTKPEWMAMVKSGELDYIDYQRSNTEIRVSGDTAVVTGQTVVIIKRHGLVIDLPPARFTSTFVKQEGQWRLLARHAGNIEQ